MQIDLQTTMHGLEVISFQRHSLPQKFKWMHENRGYFLPEAFTSTAKQPHHQLCTLRELLLAHFYPFDMCVHKSMRIEKQERTSVLCKHLKTKSMSNRFGLRFAGHFMLLDMTVTSTDGHATVLAGTTYVKCLLLLASGQWQRQIKYSRFHSSHWTFAKTPFTYKFKLGCCFAYREDHSKHECINRSVERKDNKKNGWYRCWYTKLQLQYRIVLTLL
jgi:hypothetical protein